MHLVAQSHLILCHPMDFSPSGSSVHGDSPGKNTGVGCHVLLQCDNIWHTKILTVPIITASYVYKGAWTPKFYILVLKNKIRNVTLTQARLFLKIYTIISNHFLSNQEEQHKKYPTSPAATTLIWKSKTVPFSSFFF